MAAKSAVTTLVLVSLLKVKGLPLAGLAPLRLAIARAATPKGLPPLEVEALIF